MTKPFITINVKKLADRWGIETIDLLYIFFNHKLNMFHPQDGVMSTKEILERFYKGKDASDYVFSRADVDELETKLGMDGKIPLSEFIRCKDLMVRWEMNDDQIYMMMPDKKLKAIDPFGQEIKHDFLSPLLENGTLEISELLFRLSDIEEFEAENPDIIPEQADDREPKKKQRPSQIHREQCREVAEKLWEKDPTITIADMAYKDEINALFDGKIYVEKTIRNWINDLCPDRSPGRRSQKK